MDLAVAFGKVIRELRLNAGLTQEQLGLEADLRRTFISLLELGEQHPSLTTVFKIADALGVNASEIIEKTELLLRQTPQRPVRKPNPR